MVWSYEKVLGSRTSRELVSMYKGDGSQSATTGRPKVVPVWCDAVVIAYQMWAGRETGTRWDAGQGQSGRFQAGEVKEWTVVGRDKQGARWVCSECGMEARRVDMRESEQVGDDDG